MEGEECDVLIQKRKRRTFWAKPSFSKGMSEELLVSLTKQNSSREMYSPTQ